MKINEQYRAYSGMWYVVCGMILTLSSCKKFQGNAGKGGEDEEDEVVVEINSGDPSLSNGDASSRLVDRSQTSAPQEVYDECNKIRRELSNSSYEITYGEWYTWGNRFLKAFKKKNLYSANREAYINTYNSFLTDVQRKIEESRVKFVKIESYLELYPDDKVLNYIIFEAEMSYLGHTMAAHGMPLMMANITLAHDHWAGITTDEKLNKVPGILSKECEELESVLKQAKQKYSKQLKIQEEGGTWESSDDLNTVQHQADWETRGKQEVGVITINNVYEVYLKYATDTEELLEKIQKRLLP